MRSDCRFDTNTRLGGFELLVLENDALRIEVLPALGGRIWTMHHKPTAAQWLWHNQDLAPHAVQLGDSYDDHWIGGWDDLFPNDAPGEFLGLALPDHGEWWSQPWEWSATERGPELVEVRLVRRGTVYPATCEKTLVLRAGEPSLTVRYRLTNHADSPRHFLLKLHAAVAVTPEHRLELPGGSVSPVDRAFGTIIGGPGPYAWPVVEDREGRAWDLGVCPPAELGHREFVYVAELPAGWCAVRHRKSNTTFHLTYPREVFPYVWLFVTFGGWRGHYAVVLEPCTNLPKDLWSAYRRGTCAVLGPGQALAFEIEAAIRP